MRLVFVHGMRQEGRNPAELQAVWEGVLRSKWKAMNLASLEIRPEMPFYGDELDRLTRALKQNSALVGRGATDRQVSPLEEEMMIEFKKELGITDDEVRAELGSEVIARGPANWEWVQAIGRVLERKLPAFREIGMSMVVQVDAYLSRPHVTLAVDEIVGPCLASGPVVIVAHSLGTIVSFRLLRVSAATDVPLFVTLGSPLGIRAVKDKLQPPPLKKPPNVGRWLNASDERDYVALYSSLTGDTFCDGVDNITDVVNRKDDAHSIVDYLSDSRVAKTIHKALSNPSF